MMLRVLRVYLLGCLLVSGKTLSDDEYYQLPQLFHLDDLERCYSQDGFYCVGTFHVTPLHDNASTTYNLIQEYSSDPHHFNRTLIHRGYCVTTRCQTNSSLNASQRFEDCAAEIASQDSLRTRLETLNYCRRRDDDAFVFDQWKLAFFAAISALILMNFIGTVYDLTTRNKDKRLELLMVWSVFKSWDHLTFIHTKSLKSPLAALHGIRVAVTICICISHAALIHFTIYVQNPRNLEKLVNHPLSMLIQNSTSAEQMFVVISGFWHSVNISKRSKHEPIGFSTTLVLIAKRLSRLYPVYILTVGFVTSWWSDISSGPLWPAMVGQQRNVCREKFWTHALMVNNLIQPEKLCIFTTWYMSVEIQLHIVSTIFLVVLMRLPIPKLPVLVAAFVASCLLNASLSYVFNWVPMFYLTSSPENLRTLFKEQPSFPGLYISPWGNLPACLLGVIMGYLFQDWKGKKFNLAQHKRLVTIACILMNLFLIGWMIMGYFIQDIKFKVIVVVYTALERSIFQLLMFCTYVIFNKVNGFLMNVFSWRGWHVFSRVSYSVMLVHWLVTLHIVASTPQPLTTSVTDIGMHGFITALYTFILAVPITILIEIPIKGLFEYITAKL